MKKTILITISMLAVCSVLIAVFANRLTATWQTPQHDEMSLTVQSPVEMVEQEYKEYKYEVEEELTFEANEYDTVSFAEAVSIGGAVLEKAYPFIDFNQITFAVNKQSYEKIAIQYTYDKNNLFWTVYSYVNSRTGYVENYGYSRRTKDAGDVILKEYTEKYNEDTENKLIEESLSQMEQIGYTDVKYSDTTIWEGRYNIFVTGKINGIEERVVYRYWYTQDQWSKSYHIEHNFVLYPL